MSISVGPKFWVEEPCALVSNTNIFPTKDMTRNEKLNMLTRIVIIVSGVLYALEYKQAFTFLILGLLVVILLKYGRKSTSNIPIREDFTLTPTYVDTDFHRTTVAPLFAEEWHIPAPAHDMVVNHAPPKQTFCQPPQPQSYPYGQYMTKTNLLPGDEHAINMSCGGVRQAREYANSYHLRNTLAFRDNMTKIHKKSLARRFKHNCSDTFSPFHSY